MGLLVDLTGATTIEFRRIATACVSETSVFVNLSSKSIVSILTLYSAMDSVMIDDLEIANRTRVKPRCFFKSKHAIHTCMHHDWLHALQADLPGVAAPLQGSSGQGETWFGLEALSSEETEA